MLLLVVFIPAAEHKLGQEAAGLLPSHEFWAVVLNLWVATLSEVKRPFHRGSLRPSENTDIYITIYNNSKITVMR